MAYGSKPYERLDHAAAIIRAVKDAELDDGLRQNLNSALSLIRHTSVAQEQRESRLMRQAFGPREVR